MYDRIEKQDGENVLCMLPSCWANMDTEKNGLTDFCTWQYKGEVFSVAPHISARLFSGGRKNWNHKKSVPGAMQLCTVPYTDPVTVASGFSMMATKLVCLLPMVEYDDNLE